MIEMMQRSKTIALNDVMNQRVITAPKDITLDRVAYLMREHRIGCVILIDDDGPIGIVTERDIIAKSVSLDHKPDEMTAQDIMNSPLLTATPETDIFEAARLMAVMKIRRLPVVKNSKLVGIVTENDILKIAPTLAEITREFLHMNDEVNLSDYEPKQYFVGSCENCNIFSESLVSIDGKLICEECRELQ